jgi:hypothetical protein
MNSGNPSARLRRFFHVKWEFTLAAAIRNFKDRKELFVATAREVAVVLAALLFVCLLSVAPVIEALGIALIFGCMAFVIAMFPIVLGNALLKLVSGVAIVLLATCLVCPPDSFQSEFLAVLLSPPRFILAA